MGKRKPAEKRFLGHEKIFMCWWGADYVDAGIHERTGLSISVDKGYSLIEIEVVDDLDVGQSHMFDDQQHIITRVE